MMKTQVKIYVIWLASRDVRRGQRYHSWLTSRNKRGGPRNHSEARYLRARGSCRVQLSKTTTLLARAHKRMMLKCDDDQWSSEQLSIVLLILWFYVEAQTEMMREDSFLAGRKEWK